MQKNMKYRNIFTLSLKLFMSTAVLLAAVLLIHFNRFDAVIEQQALKELENTVNQNQKTALYIFRSSQPLLQRISNTKYEARKFDNKEAFLAAIESWKELYEFKDMGVIDPSGKALSITGQELDFSNRDFFQRSMEGEIVLSSTMKDTADQEYIMIYCAPVFSDGKVQCCVYGVIDAEHLMEPFALPFSNSGHSYIIDKDGNIMTSDNKQYGNLFLYISEESGKHSEAIELFRETLKANGEGSLSYYAGEKQYAYYKPLGINDWYLFTAVSQSEVKNTYKPITNILSGFYIFLIIVFCGGITYILVLQEKQRKKLEYFAYVDGLTGKSNYTKFVLDAVEVLKNSSQGIRAILAVDINRFKMINEVLGVKEGNKTIISLEKVLRSQCREGECLGRRYADKFLLLWNARDMEELEGRVKTLCDEIICLSDNLGNIHFQCAVGVHVLEKYEKSEVNRDYIELLSSYAILAGQESKGGYTTNYSFSSLRMKNIQLRNKILEDEMNTALKNGEFVPWFQPKVDINTGKISGAEAVVRWQKENGDLLLPGSFLPFFEANGFIEKVDQEMIRKVEEYLQKWRRKGLEIFPVSINLSRAYLRSEESEKRWYENMKQEDVDSKYVQFELTETFSTGEQKILKQVISDLHDQGYKVLLDDFGIGYSSLQILQELEFDILKLDMKFIRGIGENRTEQILKSMIKLAADLNMEVIAEGVETEKQVDFLREHGVRHVQGYYYYKPMPGDEFEKLLNQA